MVIVQPTGDWAECSTEDGIIFTARTLAKDARSYGINAARIKADFYSRKTEQDEYFLIRSDVTIRDLL